MKNVRASLLKTLYDQLVTDARWALRGQGEFTWWAGAFAQHVEVERTKKVEGRSCCTVRIWTEVVREIDPASDLTEALATMNASATLSALVWDRWRGTIVEACRATVHDGNFSWLSELLSTAAVLQNAAAQSRAHSLANLTGGVPATSSHPSAGQRPDMDEPPRVSEQVKVPADTKPSQFIGAHSLDIDSFLASMNFSGSVNSHGLKCEVPFTRIPPIAGMPASSQPQTSKLEIFTEVPDPEAGGGLLCIMTLPYSVDPRRTAAAVDALNKGQFYGYTDTTLSGAWCPAPSSQSTLAFRAFLPNALSGWVTVENLVSYMSDQSHFAAGQLQAFPRTVARANNSTSDQDRLVENDLTINRRDVPGNLGCFVYRDGDRILTCSEALDELTPELAQELEGLPDDEEFINGTDDDSFILEQGIYESVDIVDALVITQFTDGRTRWTNEEIRGQIFPTSDHGDLSFESWLAAQLDAGTLRAVDVLQFIGYEDEHADEKTLITERLIVD